MEDRWETYSRVMWRFLTSYSMVIIPLYLMMVFSARRLMKLFPPLQLRSLLVLHNINCVILSVLSLILLSTGMWSEKSIFKLESTSEVTSMGLYVYWLSKYYELLDTVFMVLRHKSRQISFLHVFHHASMTFLSDYGYNYAPWPPIAFGMALNSGVHIVMYSYYAMKAFLPLQEIAWKKRITQLQILQFVLGVYIGCYGYMNEGYCIYAFLYPMALIGLFSNYYYHAFIRKKRELKKSD